MVRLTNSFLDKISQKLSRQTFTKVPESISSLGHLFPLNEVQLMIKQTTERFVAKEIAPIAANIDKNDEFPKNLWPKLGTLGLLGITVSPKFNGLSAGYLSHVIANEEISRASPSIGLSYAAHSNLCINQISLNCSEAQKQKYLTKLVDGTHIGALAMSEHTSGSDVMSMRLEAKKTSVGYILNGTKMWITNGPVADVVFVYARTSTDKISAFIVEKGFSGFSAGNKLNKMGMRGSLTSELIFNNCLVPFENLVANEGEGGRILMSGLNYERVVIAGGCIGLMRGALDCALDYVHERKQFGRPVGHFQLVQGKLADMYCKLLASKAMLYSIASACDDGNVQNAECAASILFCAEKASEVATDAIQCLGGNGYINHDYPVSMLSRDAKLFEIGAGTSEIRRMIIGREFNRAYKKNNE